MKSATNIILCFFVACLVFSCNTQDIDEYIANKTKERNEQSEKKDTVKPDTVTPVKPDTVKPDTVTPTPPVTPVYPTFDAPEWDKHIVTSFENTMTVFASLPDSLASSFTAIDEMAVLCGDVVRGSLTYTKLSDTQGIWMGMVYGNTNDALKVGYYQASSSHLYYTNSTFSFKADGHYGTLDTPITLGFSIVTKK